jgi:hypothetical protein
MWRACDSVPLMFEPYRQPPESDEELRARLLNSALVAARTGGQQMLFETVLYQAALLLDPPRTMWGETVGLGWFRVHVVGSACSELENRLSSRIQFCEIVEVVTHEA